MKKLIALICIAILSSAGLFAQEEADTNNTTNDQDTIKITWGKSKIFVVGDHDVDTVIKVKKVKQRYNHFAGLDIGVNGFLNPDLSVDLQKDAHFMDLDYAKSITFSWNFYERYIPIAKEKFGISTGLGIEFNNYTLDRDVVLFTDKDTTFGFADTTRSISKNKFKSTMLNLPLMLETNIGRDAEHSFHLAAGAMVSYRVGSKSKQVYKQDGKDFKVKNRTDFNMNPFRFSLVARAGYGNFTVFATYGITPLFEDDKGPEIYPFSVGIALAAF